MKITDLTVEVRDKTLVRIGQILPSDLLGLELALRFNKVGAWKISLRSDHPLVDSLRAPGAGIIVTAPTGVILSGPMISATNDKTADDPIGSWTITGTDDSIVLGERIAYPDPSTADLAAMASAYDTRTGKAETVVKAYVNANIGPSAPTARKISALTIETDLGRGATVTGSARFETLGSLLEQLLATSALGFDIAQSGSNLVFKVFEPVDRSAYIRMDVDNLRLSSSSYSYTRPEITRAIVGGEGSGIGRKIIERSSTDSTTAETDWNRRIEVFVDERNTSDTTELQLAGDQLLTEKGKTVKAIAVKPSDDQIMAYGRDWGLGDKITIVVNSEEIKQVVTEVAIVVTTDGVKIGATVGDPVVAAAGETETNVISTQSSQDTRISNLERNEAGANGFLAATAMRQYVKNSTGSTLYKGQAVYISSSDSSAEIPSVSLAKADAETTSSKTLGLLVQDVANGGFGFVISEGILENVDTSGSTAGQAVWLSESTAGGRVYGSMPAAPAHGVYLGIVLRSQTNNGKLYVKIQNGYELNELHNVLIGSLSDNNILAYDAVSGLWKNQTATQAGVADLAGCTYTGDINGGTIYMTNWFRSWDNSGWYNQTYGGGMWMSDSTYIRTYGGKKFCVNNGAGAETIIDGATIDFNGGPGAINFNNDDWITYNDSDNYYSFGADSSAEAGSIRCSNINIGGKTGNIPETVVGALIASAGYGSFARSNGVPLYCHRFSSSGTTAVASFYYNGSVAGYINTSAGATPAFSSTSDYRVKEDVTPVTDAIDRMRKAQAYTFRKIASVDPEQQLQTGFIAHELAEVHSDAVLGEKDAVDENGEPVYQEVMDAKLIPIMAQAIRDLIEKNDALEARLAKLENK